MLLTGVAVALATAVCVAGLDCDHITPEYQRQLKGSLQKDSCKTIVILIQSGGRVQDPSNVPSWVTTTTQTVGFHIGVEIFASHRTVFFVMLVRKVTCIAPT